MKCKKCGTIVRCENRKLLKGVMRSFGYKESWRPIRIKYCPVCGIPYKRIKKWIPKRYKRFMLLDNCFAIAGQKIKINKVDFTNYQKNPVVMWAHDYHVGPIGKCIEIKNKIYNFGKRLLCKIEFNDEQYEDMIDKGILKFEPSFLIKCNDGIYPKGTPTAELLEISCLPKRKIRTNLKINTEGGE